MSSMHHPLKSLKTLLLAGVMASATLAASAQTVAPALPATGPTTARTTGQHGEAMGRRDPAQMQARMARHQADLKSNLKLTPAQEGAWTAFTANMQTPAHGPRMTPEQRADMSKLTTPERIDKMRALRSQRMTDMNASMNKRGDAVKTFYAELNADQKKVFDNQHMGPTGHMGGKGGMGHGGGHGSRHKG